MIRTLRHWSVSLGDARLAPRERLLRLGTSKVRGVLADQEFVRGGDGDVALVRHDLGRDAAAFERTRHATVVAGILAGGVPGVTRWLGLAPGAELLVAEQTADGAAGVAGMIRWQLDRGANVVLTEFQLGARIAV